MKSEKYNLLKSLESLGKVLLLALLVLLSWVIAPRAQAQPYSVYQPNFYRQDTNATPLTLTNGQARVFPANGTNSYEQTVRPNTGLSVFVMVVSSNSVAGNSKLGWDVSHDGTIYTTTQPLTFTFPTAAAVTGTLSTNVYWTNWPGTVLNNVRDLQLTTATNALVGGGPTTNSATYYLWYSYNNQ